MSLKILLTLRCLCGCSLQVIGAPLAAGLLYLDGHGGLRGWQWIFIGALQPLLSLQAKYCTNVLALHHELAAWHPLTVCAHAIEKWSVNMRVLHSTL